MWVDTKNVAIGVSECHGRCINAILQDFALCNDHQKVSPDPMLGVAADVVSDGQQKRIAGQISILQVSVSCLGRPNMQRIREAGMTRPQT